MPGAPTREQVYDALLAKLSAVTGIKEASRRRRPLNYFTPTNTPALMLVELKESYERKSANLPPTRTLSVGAVIINDVGNDQNALPTTAINDAIDAIDAALKPSPVSDGLVHLGTGAYAIYIQGEVEKAPGDITGKAIAVIPISIILP